MVDINVVLKVSSENLTQEVTNWTQKFSITWIVHMSCQRQSRQSEAIWRGDLFEVEKLYF